MVYGSKKTVHKTTENPYDDAWIHDRFAQGAEWNRHRFDETSRLTAVQGHQGIEIGQLRDSITGHGTDIGNLQSNFSNLSGDLSSLTDRIDNWDTTTDVGDVIGLDDTLANLRDDYQSRITGVTDQLGDYLQTSDFNTRMTNNLDALGQTLRGEWGRDIANLDLAGVRDAISSVGGDLSQLTTDFAGLSSDVNWLNDLDLGGLEDRVTTMGSDIRSDYQGDLTNLRNIVESGRGAALADLESRMGRDRTADLLDLRESLEQGRLTDIQAMAGNLRHARAGQIFDLTDTFDRRLGDLQTSLGGDVSQLFRKSGELDTGLAALTSGLGTTSQQLEALRDSFGDYRTDAATNLANVRSAFNTQVGDLGTDFTARLGDLQSSTARDILGVQTSAAADVASARSEAASNLASAKADAAAGITGARLESAQGIASAREEASTNLSNLRDYLTSERQRAIGNLDTTWSDRLSDSENRFIREQERNNEEFNRRLSDISASLNYKTLDDSAQGVKIRRSRAYDSGRTRAGTGQLARSMKINTLNI